MSLSFEILLFVISVLSVGVYIGMAWYYDRRDLGGRVKRQESRAYHCVKCGFLYSSVGEAEHVAACPKCEFKNSRLQFQ